MNFEKVSVGSIRIDGVTYEEDVVIDREVRDQFSHMPLSVEKTDPPHR